ncbi:hypothetical protein, partial [Glaciimonas soli]
MAEIKKKPKLRLFTSDEDEGTDLPQAMASATAWENGGKPKKIKAHFSVPPQQAMDNDVRNIDEHIEALASRAAEPSSHINERLALILAARNPLYEAAKPILLTL